MGTPHAERRKTVGRHLQANSNGTACTCCSPSPGLAHVFPSCPGDQDTTLVMHCRRGQTARRTASGPRGEGPLPHRVAVQPRRRVAGGAARGGVVAVPRRPRTAGGRLGGGKAPSCFRVWSARTPTL